MIKNKNTHIPDLLDLLIRHFPDLSLICPFPHLSEFRTFLTDFSEFNI